MIEDIIGGIVEAVGDVVFDAASRKVKNVKHDKSVKKAASVLKDGGLVAFPTETVYGLGADAFNASAVAKIYEAKGRPSDNPLILHIAKAEQLFELADAVPGYANALIDNFWPGALTLIVKKKLDLPGWVGGHPHNHTHTIGVRIPSHPVALAFLKAAECPVAAPSANKSGRPSPTTIKHVKDDFAATGEINYILDGDDSEIGIESTVVDVTGDAPVILRPGAITREMIQNATGLSLGEASKTNTLRSPGVKYRHYAPQAPMTILSGTPDSIAAYMLEDADSHIGLLISSETKKLLGSQKKSNVIILSDNPDEIAQSLFANLRKFDKLGVTKIYVQAIPDTGIGVAIMDRMLKAAEGRIINV